MSRTWSDHSIRTPEIAANIDPAHDCLFCGAYVNTECARCGELIMSFVPGNDALNGLMDICYQCELDMISRAEL